MLPLPLFLSGKKKGENLVSSILSRNRPLSSPAALNQIPRRGIDAAYSDFPLGGRRKSRLNYSFLRPSSQLATVRKKRSWQRRRQNVRFRKCFSRKFDVTQIRENGFFGCGKKCHARIQTTDIYLAERILYRNDDKTNVAIFLSPNLYVTYFTFPLKNGRKCKTSWKRKC